MPVESMRMTSSQSTTTVRGSRPDSHGVTVAPDQNDVAILAVRVGLDMM